MQLQFTTLISAAELNACIAAPNLVVIDCRFDLARPEAGAQAFASGHLPHARYAHLNDDLSGPVTPSTGRHPLPDPAVLANTLGRLGIDKTKQVVAYDADTGMFASRLWWLLRWMGHDAVAVLDGGLRAWQQAGFSLHADVETTRAVRFQREAARVAATTTAEISELLRTGQLEDGTWRLIDARAAERFNGVVEPIDPVAGHIPGAINHPLALNMNQQGQLLSATELAQRYRETLGATAADHVIAMCGSGVTACHNLLAMEIADLKGAKLYAGSWSEWIRDPGRPIATHTAAKE